MSTTPPSHTIHHIPPPGPTVLPLARRLCSPPSSSSSSNLSSPHPSPLPPYFTAAILIRQAVFVEEQHCDAAEEVDADDARSWHWVLYHTAPPPPLPPPASKVDDGGGSTSPPPPTAPAPAPAAVAAATIRLVPVNGASGGDAHWAIKPGWGVPDYGNSEIWDGEEGYVKVGRLATVKGARGKGFGRVLVEECVRWARENGGEVGRGVRAAAAEEGQSENGRDRGGWKGLVGCHAQKYLEGWYGKLGFVRDRGMGEWEEDSIPHVGMWMRVEV